MIRLIDADALIKRIPTVMDMQELYLPIHFIEWLIDEAPTIDSVEVVRCRDCKEFEAIGYCLFWGDDVDADGYCSCGEREGK